MLRREGLNIPISKPSFRRNWYSGVSQKKSCRRLNLLANIGSLIAKAHQLNYSFLIFTMYLFLSCKSLPFYNSMYNSSYVNALPKPSAQRRRNKGEPQSYIWYYYLKKVTFTGKSITCGASRFDEPQPRPLFYGYTYKNKGLIAFSQIWTAWLFCLVKTMLL